MREIRRYLLAAVHLIPSLPSSATTTATAELAPSDAPDPATEEEAGVAPEFSRLSAAEAAREEKRAETRGVVIPRGSIAISGSESKGGLGLLKDLSSGGIFGRLGVGSLVNLLKDGAASTESSRMQEGFGFGLVLGLGLGLGP